MRVKTQHHILTSETSLELVTSSGPKIWMIIVLDVVPWSSQTQSHKSRLFTSKTDSFSFITSNTTRIKNHEWLVTSCVRSRDGGLITNDIHSYTYSVLIITCYKVWKFFGTILKYGHRCNPVYRSLLTDRVPKLYIKFCPVLSNPISIWSDTVFNEWNPKGSLNKKLIRTNCKLIYWIF